MTDRLSDLVALMHIECASEPVQNHAHQATDLLVIGHLSGGRQRVQAVLGEFFRTDICPHESFRRCLIDQIGEDAAQTALSISHLGASMHKRTELCC